MKRPGPGRTRAPGTSATNDTTGTQLALFPKPPDQCGPRDPFTSAQCADCTVDDRQRLTRPERIDVSGVAFGVVHLYGVDTAAELAEALTVMVGEVRRCRPLRLVVER